MGETRDIDITADEGDREETLASTACTRRRNGLWNIFEGVDADLMHKLSRLSLELVQELVSDSPHDPSCPMDTPCPETSSQSQCRPSRLQRSFSAAVAGDEKEASQQSRQRRNAVGNLLEVLTPAQRLLLVEHLEQIHALDFDITDSDVIMSLSTSSASSSSTSSRVNSSRSQGQIICS